MLSLTIQLEFKVHKGAPEEHVISFIKNYLRCGLPSLNRLVLNLKQFLKIKSSLSILIISRSDNFMATFYELLITLWPMIFYKILLSVA